MFLLCNSHTVEQLPYTDDAVSYPVHSNSLQPISLGLAASEPVALLHYSVSVQQVFPLRLSFICDLWVLGWW